jgi:ubiquinol-cytochrome c reductase cytochrome b subunit
MWTTWVRERAVSSLPPEKLLPDRQPSYVSSWIYVFGVATIAALVVVIASGMILGLGGPTWWHTTSLGRVAPQLRAARVPLLKAATGPGLSLSM